MSDGLSAVCDCDRGVLPRDAIGALLFAEVS